MPSPFMPMYKPLFSPWMATTLSPTGIRLNRAAEQTGGGKGQRNKETEAKETHQLSFHLWKISVIYLKQESKTFWWRKRGQSI